MSHRHLAQRKLTLVHAILIAAAALPLACAVGVEPDFDDSGAPLSQGGKAGAGTAGTSAVSLAGTTANASGGQISNAVGGTSATAGKSSGAAGGSAASGAGGASAGGAGGSANAAGAGGASALSCACPQPIVWQDDHVLNWSPGDCLTVELKNYLYIGAKPQNYANHQCNPARQEPWCTDSGNDYKFMPCD